jgi:hypothetical protein
MLARKTYPSLSGGFCPRKGSIRCLRCSWVLLAFVFAVTLIARMLHGVNDAVLLWPARSRDQSERFSQPRAAIVHNVWQALCGASQHRGTRFLSSRCFTIRDRLGKDLLLANQPYQ